MKKCLLALLLIGTLLHFYSTESDAGFLIKFKNGRTLSAENYRIEGNDILLYLSSGAVKVSRDEVQSILETKEEMKQESAAETKVEKKETSKNLGTTKTEKTGKDVALPKSEIDSYIKKKAEIGGRLQEAKKVYFDTVEKSEKEKARQTMISISKELYSLQDEVIKRNNGVLPEWWKEN